MLTKSCTGVMDPGATMNVMEMAPSTVDPSVLIADESCDLEWAGRAGSDVLREIGEENRFD